MTDQTDNTLTTSTGKTVTLKPILGLMESFVAAHPDPEPPVYEVKVELTGVTERHVLTAENATTDEEKSRLADYALRLRESNRKRGDDFLKMLILRGLCEFMPSSDDWEKEQALFGITVPVDPIAKRLHYARTEVFVTKQDYEDLTLRFSQVCGVDEELVAQARASFRHEVSR